MADQLIPDIPTLLDSNGEPLALGSVTLYETGTTTLLSVFSDEAATVPLANPVVLDAAGRAPQVFYAGSTAAKAVIKTAAGATVRTIDPIQRAAQASSAASDVSFTPIANNPQTTVQAAIEANANAIAVSRVGRQRIDNGQFDIWTEGASLPPDRWNVESNGSTEATSRQTFTIGQTSVPGEPEFFARVVPTTSSGSGNYVRMTQRIRGVRTFAGQNVTLQFYGSADSSKNIAVELVQNFGTGGSSEVTGIGSQRVALATSWAQTTITIAVPSISGKTIGTAEDDYLELVFWFDAGSTFDARTATLGQQSGTFNLSLVMIEKGEAASPFEYRSKRASFLETSLPASGALSNRNRIINGGFSINQEGVSGSVVLSAGEYGHDMWKAGASGCSYTFATSENVTTITISAGSLIQVIEGINLQSGTHTLSWGGTVQMKIDGGAAGDSGMTGTATGGTNLEVETSGTGTVTAVQLEVGDTATPFEHRGDELARCQQYYYKLDSHNFHYVPTFSDGSEFRIETIHLPVTMRSAPFCAITGAAGGGATFISGMPKVEAATTTIASCRLDVTPATGWARIVSFSADARL